MLNSRHYEDDVGSLFLLRFARQSEQAIPTRLEHFPNRLGMRLMTRERPVISNPVM
jgi:hypothetical protein